MPRAIRYSANGLLALRVRSGDANALPEPGAVESPVYAISTMNDKLGALDMRAYGNRKSAIALYNFHLPSDDRELAMK